MVIKENLYRPFLLLAVQVVLLFLALTSMAQSLDPSVHLRGLVMPDKQIKIAFSQAGLLAEVLGSGNTAEQGQILASIDDKTARAEVLLHQAMLSTALSDLKSAQHSWDKSARLVKENILSEIALVEADFVIESARSRLDAAQAQLNLSKIKLDACRIKAPFKGAVLALNAHKNEWVMPGDPILEYADLVNLTLSIYVPPEFAQQIKLGLETSISIGNQVVGQATVKQIFPSIDPASGLLRIVWSVKSKNKQLLSGQYVELKNWLP